MYVCLCKGVSDKTIRRAVDDGLSSMRELRQQYGVGSQCGCCTQCAKTVLKEAVAERKQQKQFETLLPIQVCYA
ncbi:MULTISPECIES: bacterioferritin-associated ferredoxin [Idiomarinaceae]|uniref:Bacterioferritin-associated ferredoxin n=4 Tax=Pseudidiomarina TaxID=2800384 RepID=A0A368V3X9_9GAMM|nr:MULTISPECIES: bacterioferritin-associated ferredoxin [Idiomarinaceae]MDT7525295.1 bacterioferritin-associated ferredoxin [Pseudidiomarina sp. GXY010]MDX1524628.1 bacterioferritin-associated ferredoxin [Pseudidiomarina maritima]MRJ41158.1 (2Fe-2S)-binding protein [Idiomarina sp. FeN1]NCU56323.1 (2Fe-2S)-binding protein [Idiomarina sp. FenA--70]NCU59342.1 (2Fe-2S)-binding protein [Idiomarina sp. FenBw--71]